LPHELHSMVEWQWGYWVEVVSIAVSRSQTLLAIIGIHYSFLSTSLRNVLIQMLETFMTLEWNWLPLVFTAEMTMPDMLWKERWAYTPCILYFGQTLGWWAWPFYFYQKQAMLYEGSLYHLKAQ